MINTTFIKAFKLLTLLRVEEESIPFAIKAKGSNGQVSVPAGTDMSPVLGMGTLGRRGRFITLDFTT